MQIAGQKKRKVDSGNDFIENLPVTSDNFLQQNNLSSYEISTQTNDFEPKNKSQREIELEEMLTGLKDKFSSLDQHDPLKLRILTIAPLSWSTRKVQNEFGVSAFASKS